MIKTNHGRTWMAVIATSVTERRRRIQAAAKTPSSPARPKVDWNHC